jgi:hypothetical protein
MIGTLMSTNTLLPDAELAGDVRRWYLPVDPVDGTRSDDPEHLVLYGRFLGLGSSRTDAHQPHRERYVPRGIRCNACRWFEARIFRELVLPDGVDDLTALTGPDDVRLGDYVIHSAGMSIVDDEVPLFRCETTRSPFMVVELMTTRRRTDQGSEVFLAKPAARALAEAAQHDAALRDAYLNRAVE